jgi:cytochrome bd-type quinol oxidase subunit 2
MIGFLIWTGLGVVILALNVLYRLWLRNKRNDGEPVRTMSHGQRIAVAVVGGVLILAGLAALVMR